MFPRGPWPLFLLCLTACATSADGGRPGGAPVRPTRVVVMSIDGLMPAVYEAPDAHDLAVPHLRRLRAEGASSAGALSVFPAVTYPAHTSIATGHTPARHGITTNLAPDAAGKNMQGWRWYAEDIRVPPLWQIAEAAGVRTALVNWPVTVGAQVSALVPEYWRAGTGDDAKLSRALSTAGLLDAVAAHHPGFWSRFTPPDVKDEASIDIALYLLAQPELGLVMVHVWQTDHIQHRQGPWSDAARATIEGVDTQIGRIMGALDRKDLLVVVSDHGFRQVHAQARPGVRLVEVGLVTSDHDGRVVDPRVRVVTNGGLALLYLRDEGDDEAVARAFAAFASGAGADAPWGRRFDRAAVRAAGGDPAAFMAVEASAGHAFAPGYDGPLVTPTSHPGQHGFAPDQPDMRAALLLWGAAIAPGRIDEARLVDVAPTVAHALGLTMPGTAGRVLPVFTDRAAPPRTAVLRRAREPDSPARNPGASR